MVERIGILRCASHSKRRIRMLRSGWQSGWQYGDGQLRWVL